MQEEPLQAVRAAPRGPRAVNGVARDGMAQGRQVDPDLVGPAGDEVHFQEGPSTEALANPVPGDGWPSVGDHGHPGPLPRIAPDRRLDPAGGRLYAALDQREVRLLYAARLELRHEAGLGRVRLGNHDQPGRVAVQAMHDPGPLDARDAAVFRVARQERIDHRPAPVPGRRVDDEPGRLVDHQHVRVLVQDLKRDRLGLDVGRLRRRNAEEQRVPGPYDRARLEGHPVDGQVPIDDQALDPVSYTHLT